MFAGGLAIWTLIIRPELLRGGKVGRVLLAVSVVLFLVGITLHFTSTARDSASGALLSPLPSIGLFRICRNVFLKLFGREPRDTYLNWQPGLGPDRVFNIVYFSLAFLLLMLGTIGMMKLAKIGL